MNEEKKEEIKIDSNAADEFIASVKAATLTDKMSRYSDYETKLGAAANTFYESVSVSSPVTHSGVHHSITDSYSNGLLNIGTNENGTARGSMSYDEYTLSNQTLNWGLWLALYNDSWVFRKAIDQPAEDEVSCGISFHNTSDTKPIYKELNTLSSQLIELLKWGALYGGSIGVLMFSGLKDEDYAKRIDYNKIKPETKTYMYVTDRWYGCAQEGLKTVNRMTDADFGKPRYYTVMFADGHSIRVHHSFILRYEHRSGPKFMKNGMLQGWGYAEGAHIYNEIIHNDKLKTSIQSLVDKALIEVVKMPGMRGVFMGTDKGNETQLKKRLEMVVWGRNYNSLTFLDKDDEYSQNTFSGLSGLADLLEQNRWQIAAALDMQGMLYGDMKNGMGADTQAIRRYNKTIKGRCESWYRPCLYKLCKVLFKKHGIKEDPDFTFNAVYKDEEDKAKIEMLAAYEDLLAKLEGNGIITKVQNAESFINYMNSGAISISITDADKEAVSENSKKSTEFSGTGFDESLEDTSFGNTDYGGAETESETESVSQPETRTTASVGSVTSMEGVE